MSVLQPCLGSSQQQLFVCWAWAFLCASGAVQTGHASDAFTFIKRGDALLASREYTSAVGAFTQAIDTDPKQLLAYTKRAAAYVASGKHSLALKDLSMSVELDPEATPALLKRAQLHVQLCMFDAAEIDVAAVLALKPGHKAAGAVRDQIASGRRHLQSAQLHGAARDFAATDKWLTELWKVAADCLPARLLSAQMYFDEAKFEESLAESGRLLKLEPGNVEALILRGKGYYRLQDFDMAKRHYGEVLTKYDPENAEAKRLHSGIRALQKRAARVTAAVASKEWVDVEQQSSSMLHEVEESLTQLRQQLWLQLAQARFHLKLGTDGVLEAVDASLHYGHQEAAVLLKVRALTRAERLEAAVQALEQAIKEHGQTRGLVNALGEARQALKISRQKDYYKVLGVARDADERTLKRVYRRLALLYHPDKVEGDKEEGERKFAEINEAYEILTDPEKRELHDRGEDPNDPHAGQGFHHGHGFPGGFGGFPGGTFHQGGRTFNVRFG